MYLSECTICRALVFVRTTRHYRVSLTRLFIMEKYSVTRQREFTDALGFQETSLVNSPYAEALADSSKICEEESGFRRIQRRKLSVTLRPALSASQGRHRSANLAWRSSEPCRTHYKSYCCYFGQESETVRLISIPINNIAFPNHAVIVFSLHSK